MRPVVSLERYPADSAAYCDRLLALLTCDGQQRPSLLRGSLGCIATPTTIQLGAIELSGSRLSAGQHAWRDVHVSITVVRPDHVPDVARMGVVGSEKPQKPFRTKGLAVAAGAPAG